MATGIAPFCGILKCLCRTKLKGQQRFLGGFFSVGPFRLQQNVQVAETEKCEVVRRDQSKYGGVENTVSKEE